MASGSHVFVTKNRVHVNTTSRRFAELAQYASFDVLEHTRRYAAHGTSEWDGGTHLSIMMALE